MKELTLLFLRRENEILLAMKKRGFGAGKWNGVGGKLEPGESIEQALVRECKEEINVTPVYYDKVAEHTFIQDANTKPWPMLVHVYFCNQWQGEPQESEEMLPKWYSTSDIPYPEMWDDDVYWLPKVLAGKYIKGNFSFDENDSMIDHTLEEVAGWN